MADQTKPADQAPNEEESPPPIVECGSAQGGTAESETTSHAETPTLEQSDALALVGASFHERTSAQLDLLLSRMEAMQKQLDVLMAEPKPVETPLAPEKLTDELRRVLAGACKTLKINKPTPAIVGRIMHDKKIFSPRTSLKASQVLLGIVDCDEGGLHLTEADLARVKASESKFCSALLDKRLNLLENTNLVHRNKRSHGSRVEYERYLSENGQDVFNGWPEWTDPSGGIGLASTPPPPPPATPTS